MGRLKNVKIVIEGRQPFKPGDVVKGTASFLLEQNVKVKFIKLTFDGICKVKWTKSTDDDEKVYKSLEVYFSQDKFLHQEAGGRGITVTAGQHRTPFQFTLPSNIPSSFGAKHGNINYSVKLTAEYPGVFKDDDIHAEGFRVVNPINLYVDRPASEFATRQTRIQQEMNDYVCCGFSRDILKFDIATDKSAYEPGESIIINGYLMNGCSRPTEKVSMVLYQVLTFYGTRSNFSLTSSGNTKSKVKKNRVAVWVGEKVDARATKSYANQKTISVPDVPESDLKNCQNIDVKYAIKFKAMLTGILGIYVSSDYYPIFIGNGQPTAANARDDLLPTAPETTVISPLLFTPSGAQQTVGFTPAQTGAPPSYSAAVRMGKTEVSVAAAAPPAEDTIPKGSYYDWSASAFTYS